MLGKREDGFYEIATLIQAISFGDILIFEPDEKERLTTSNPRLPCDKNNLIIRALRLFQNWIHDASTHRLEKHIPIRRRIGRGQWQRCYYALGLNKMSGLSIKKSVLSTWAGELSSDAPSFFSSGTAFVTGKGEIVENLTPFYRDLITGMLSHRVEKVISQHGPSTIAYVLINTLSLHEIQQS